VPDSVNPNPVPTEPRQSGNALQQGGLARHGSNVP
jgi:hypothetical protein